MNVFVLFGVLKGEMGTFAGQLIENVISYSYTQKGSNWQECNWQEVVNNLYVVHL